MRTRLGFLVLLTSGGCLELPAETDPVQMGWSCVTAQTRDGQVALVQFEVATGNQVELRRFEVPGSSFRTSHLAHTGSTWAAISSSDDQLQVFDTATGTSWTGDAPEDLESLSGLDDELVGLTDLNELVRFGSVDALKSDTRASTLDTPFQTVSRFTMSTPSVAVGAWHSTEHIEIVDLDAGTQSEVVLQAWDGWVHGMAVVGDELVLLGPSDESGHSRIAVFDLETGNLISDLTLPDWRPSGSSYGQLSGLWCNPR